MYEEVHLELKLEPAVCANPFDHRSWGPYRSEKLEKGFLMRRKAAFHLTAGTVNRTEESQEG